MWRTLTKNSAAGIVEEGLQPGTLRLGAPGPDNVTVVKERENVGFKEEKKKRLRKKPIWEMAKKIEVARHFDTNRVDVVWPCECVNDGDSHAGTYLKEQTCSIWLPSTLSSKVLSVVFLLKWKSILFVFKVFNLKPLFWSHRFARLRQVWSEDWNCVSLVQYEVQCGHMYSVVGMHSLLYQSLFDSVLIMDFNNIATCLGMTFLYWGMCKVTPHFGCSSVADVYRYITA